MGILQTAQYPPALSVFQSSTLMDEFYNYTSAGGPWTTVTTNSGTVVASAALAVAADSLLYTTGTTADNYVGVETTLASFLFTNGIGMFAEQVINWTDVSSLNAAILFGFASANVVTASSAVPTTSYSGAMIMRIPGSNVWSCQSSNGTTKTYNVSTTPANGAGSYLLHIDIFNWDNLNAGISYSVNQTPLVDATTGNQIVHKVAYASLAAANIRSTIQTSTNAAQTAYVDYIAASKFRNLIYNYN